MKNKIKKIVSMIILTTMVGGVIGCSKDKSLKSEVIVGFDNTFVPMGFLDDKGEIAGFDIDLAKEVFKRLEMDVKFQPIDWTMKETELNSGNIDVIWNGYSLTEERKQKVSYTESYMENKQIIVTLKNSSIKTKKDLNGKILGTQQGSSGQDAIEKDKSLVEKIDNKSPVLYDTYDKSLRDLEIGRIDAICGDEVLLKYYVNQKDKNIYNILDENLGTEDYVVAVKKDNTELRDKINSTLKKMKEDKSFNEIYSKWF